MTLEADNLLILGAGFSRNAGLPLASQFTRELLNLRGLKLDGPSARQVAYIRAFVDSVFGEGASRSHDEWPELEDIFTLVDLSANTGHHLGPAHSASDLRMVRRSIIVRMIRMLAQAYARGRDKQNTDWITLEGFFTRFDASTSAVLSMNWDTVFEQGIARTQKISNVEYGCGAAPFRFETGKLKQRKVAAEILTVLKPHGSVNWLYCDACRDMFWVAPNQTEWVAQTLFRATGTQSGQRGYLGRLRWSPSAHGAGRKASVPASRHSATARRSTFRCMPRAGARQRSFSRARVTGSSSAIRCRPPISTSNTCSSESSSANACGLGSQ
jgi:hypothetical protein